MTRGASSGEDRATRARPEPASGLGHPAGIPSAESQGVASRPPATPIPVGPAYRGEASLARSLAERKASGAI
jgi:hypothetical protein